MLPIQQWTDNDWTAIGTMLGAIGTVGAFAVALYLLRTQIADRRRSQARLVNVRIAEMRMDAEPLPLFVVRVDNSSEEPAYGVRIQLVYGNSARSFEKLAFWVHRR